jgi:hypothetical protein
MTVMRRTLVALVLAFAVLGAGCSSPQQPSTAVVAAQKQVQVWQAAVRADQKSLAAECPHTPIACVVDTADFTRLAAARAHLARAEAALERAEGSPVSTTSTCPTGSFCKVFKEPTTTTTCITTPGQTFGWCKPISSP